MKSDFVTDTRAARAASALLPALLLAALLSACAGPEPVARDVPPPPVTSVAQADQQLAAVARERAAIEARFAERERVCYDKFFVNRCLDDAKEHRRTALAAQRAIEVQAERFKRQAIADERDRNVAEAERRFEEQDARMAAEPPKPAPTPTPVPPPRKPVAPGRIAERDARLRTAQQQEAADAGKRAQNVRDYEARKAEAEERQRKVAQRKAEKAAKAAQDAKDGKGTKDPAAIK
jgi:hypothetical protein